MARNALFITPYWIDRCNQRLPTCLNVQPHRCVSRSFKRAIDRRKLLSPQMIRLAPILPHLAAIGMLLDWLTSGGILPFNPAASVRGPKHIIKRGKTPVLTAAEAR